MIHEIDTKLQWGEFLGRARSLGIRYSSITAVDPDTEESGVAYYGPEEDKVLIDTVPLNMLCADLRRGQVPGLHLVVVESQRVFPGATQRTKSIVRLARIAGLAAGAATAPLAEVVFLDPCVWKGQIKKPTKVAQRMEYVVHQRNMAKLSGQNAGSYARALREAKSKGRDFQFEAMDAVGILLFTLEGLGVEL